MNRVILYGILEAPPETRHTGKTQVTTLRLKTTEEYLSAQKERKSRYEWHRVVVWGARSVLRELSRDCWVLVEGSLRTSSYDDRDGNKRYKTEIHASNVMLVKAFGHSDEAVPDPEDYGEDPPADDDIPF